MIKVLISGISGKMGNELINAINETDDMKVTCGICRSKIDVDIPTYKNINDVKEKFDVIIDFSRPDLTMEILDFLKNKNIPIVIATTGFSDEELNRINDYSKYISIFKSSNMSFEINIICNIVSKLSNLLKDSDIEIVETHHRNKIDSPSGTALMIANSINESRNNEMDYIYDRHSIKNKRSDKEIGIHSIRGGNEVGKHSILFFGNDESLEITHTVNSRKVFALGALKAARFIINQKNGLYNMNDLIEGVRINEKI